MKDTALDRVFQTTNSNKGIPVYAQLQTALLETKPEPYMWFDWPQAFEAPIPLPACAITWPASAFCLTADNGITAGTYQLSVLRLPYSAQFTGWLAQVPWQLQAVMVFHYKPTEFDVIGLAGTRVGPIMFPEAQLHFTLVEGNKWNWQYATTGVVNHTFYNVACQDIPEDKRAELDYAFDYLGSLYSYFLGTWLAELGKPGEWIKYRPKPPRVQVKNGKIKKVLRMPLLGYSHYKVHA